LVVRPLQDFLRLEASGGLVLLVATVAALVWANLAAGAYEDVWTTEVTLRIGDYELIETVRDLVNDGLMAIFFLVIGLEVKRELVIGELSARGAALLPLFAAVGGMVIPALVFLAVIGGEEGSGGWGIPMATDVAFALGALAALGRRVPPGLVAFLLGVAVIDDIGAILVIAIYYTDALALGWLAAAACGLIAIVALQRVQVRHIGPYIVLGVAIWVCTLESGVHPTIAGVAIGLLTPARPFQEPAAVSAEAIRIAGETADDPGDPDEDAGHWRQLAWLSREAISPLTRVEHGLHGLSSFVVLPTFALANAGIVLDAESLEAATETRVALAVALGLVLGKAIGLTAGVAIAIRLGLSALPAGVRWAHVVGVGALAGIGFTVSLFLAGLAYSDPELLDAAKIGVLGGSLVAAAAGISALLVAGRHRGSSARRGADSTRGRRGRQAGPDRTTTEGTQCSP
jgi:NhaA family Na+:H+ antiporter